MPPVTLDTPFGLSIDLSFWQWFFGLSSFGQAETVFALGGWTILFYIFFKAGAELWVEYRQKTKFMAKWQWVLLAVDVPALFIQTPKAVEQIFAHLSGASVSCNIPEKFWRGKKQKWFSFEIVSIEGYIQFLVRTEIEYRDLVEAAIYAQYTEAEITEVEEYVDSIPDKYPTNEYDIFGVEFQLAQNEAFPIRTYPSFEYKMGKDASVLSDPMAALLENFTRIGHGEDLWMHLLIEPTGNAWKEKGIAVVKELMGQKADKKSSILSSILSFPQSFLGELLGALSGPSEGAPEEKKERKELTPGMRSTVEAVEEKIAKIGFKSKLRVLYAARKEVYNPSHCIDGFIGAVNQFHMMNRNALVPYAVTLARYDGKKKKTTRLKNTFIKTFKKRKMRWKKSNGYILNIEELATIWHFPLPFVKTPLLQKAGYKRAEPPSGLPVEALENPLRKKKGEGEKSLPAEAVPPENLPYA
ncbi:MAG: hypothetical protein A2754_02865 [Candidatus Magasanikbacteria bacterium RIFCSPHIGHO2_01_FULL_47_8]|uniref:DUF8128 domain-containing protein n=1 Tax=Candidatus Magasanikbacteria bacterium RIFCSPHIGHO2_01_FULL_47_8 TaxID=1798673 RepID=A0A1F6ME76_9BACT|nr:MAG: hypothetical protein A2754_02865 [Candidatus Magasanikbacteria bacterium RIFCSPHIGHO2_01_FULL_47_8]